MDFGYYNMDCMDGMKEFPDGYFDLAIVDPPYGLHEHGGKNRNTCERIKYSEKWRNITEKVYILYALNAQNPLIR